MGDFLFPCYLERYLNLALELAKVSGLVFYNARQYEKIRQSEQSFRYLSLHDALTGLYNRTYLNKILAKSENLEDARVAVFIFDIDKLKVINDTYGHAEGDRHIQAFAEILKKSFRNNDVVARIGGDEFIAVVTNSDVDLLAKIEERIKTLVNLHNETKLDPNLNLEVSLGYASQKYPEDTIEVLMKRADRRMYEQKVEKAGRS